MHVCVVWEYTLIDLRLSWILWSVTCARFSGVVLQNYCNTMYCFLFVKFLVYRAVPTFYTYDTILHSSRIMEKERKIWGRQFRLVFKGIQFSGDRFIEALLYSITLSQKILFIVVVWIWTKYSSFLPNRDISLI